MSFTDVVLIAGAMASRCYGRYGAALAANLVCLRRRLRWGGMMPQRDGNWRVMRGSCYRVDRILDAKQTTRKIKLPTWHFLLSSKAHSPKEGLYRNLLMLHGNSHDRPALGTPPNQLYALGACLSHFSLKEQQWNVMQIVVVILELLVMNLAKGRFSDGSLIWLK
ncbi:hypothetical protein [Vogesella indigofera]|uniref:hypothetical protein n=1 Tax=Vogesella indigofera TaxID=45465 RepID=UPI00234F50E1|nr:hypothetical protein [Vogesella indigofera]MDC7700564.1 hypothetical protein [Vogesella indigofera]